MKIEIKHELKHEIKDSVFQYEDGTWGWYDETWSPGDDIRYPTSEAAREALVKYAEKLDW